MKQIYESEVLFQLMERDGLNIPSSVPPYESEIKAYLINQANPSYPKLTDYEAEWLNYINENPLGKFPYLVLTDVTNATIENVVPFAYKSAILKGQTLVNLCNNVAFSKIDAQYGFWEEIANALRVNIIKDKKYFIRANVETNSFIDGSQALRLKNEAGEVQWTILNLNQKQGLVSGNFTAEINGTIVQALSESFSNTGSLVIKEIIIIEYQDGMENWDIPYFEGMQSVKMPVLTTSNEDGTKSIILTTNEDVTLRGIDDVQDTLDCLTGEVTQRITSKTLRGGDDEDWRLFNNTIIEKTETVDFLLENIEQQKNSILKCDTIKEQNIKSSYQLDEEGISCKGGSGVNIWLSLSKTKATNVAELKTYLQSNPITLQYQLATESIKTVDLSVTDQDGNTLNKVKPIEGTMHLSTSGENIRPLFSGEIPVEAITQNLASFIDLEMEE